MRRHTEESVDILDQRSKPVKIIPKSNRFKSLYPKVVEREIFKQQETK